MSPPPGALCLGLLFGPIAVLAGAVAADDGGREETGRYVASPGFDAYSQAGGAGIGRVDFAILAGESRVLVTITDAVLDNTEVDVVFFFGDAPIRHVVTFCRQHGMDIRSGATDLRVVIEDVPPDEDSICSGDHGATTGTVTARFS